MTIITAYPIESTSKVWMWNPRYSQPIQVPVIRRVFGLVLRTVYIDVLENNANIVRPAWSTYYNVGHYTVAIVRRGA